MVVHVKSATGGCDTHSQGHALYSLISPKLRVGSPVTLDFRGVQSMTSSFVNTGLIPLLDEISFDKVKSLLKVQNANRQVSNMIRDRMHSHSERRKTAA